MINTAGNPATAGRQATASASVIYRTLETAGSTVAADTRTSWTETASEVPATAEAPATLRFF